MIRRQFTQRRIQVFIGVILLGGLIFECQRVLSRPDETATVAVQGPTTPSPGAAFASPTVAPVATLTLEEQAARDPMRFLESALDRYDRSVRDYTCTFTKQELVAGEMSAEQVMNAMFREKPFSVRLEWTKNADKCSRVLYVADKWIKDGVQMAVVEPGAIARLFVPYVMRAIHGPDAAKSSRRTIDQFGLRNSLMLTLKYCKLAKEKGVLDLKYVGNGKVNERETLVFERRLPYESENGQWPDRVLVVHLDKDLMFPTLCQAYADDAKKKLLGKYMMTDIKINVNLADSVFTKQGMGLE